MLKRLLAFIQHNASGPTILVLLAVTLLLQFLMNGTELPFSRPTIEAHSGGVPILDMRLSYTPDDAYALFSALGSAGRQAYRALHLLPDVLFPIGYAFTFAFASAWFLLRLFPLDHRLQWLCMLPLVAGLADLLENVLLVAASLAYPGRIDGLVRAAQLMTRIKFGLLPIGVLFLIGLVALWFLRGRPASHVPGAG